MGDRSSLINNSRSTGLDENKLNLWLNLMNNGKTNKRKSQEIQEKDVYSSTDEDSSFDEEKDKKNKAKMQLWLNSNDE